MASQHMLSDVTLNMMEDAINTTNNLAPDLPSDGLGEIEKHLRSLRIGSLTAPAPSVPVSAPQLQPIVMWQPPYYHPRSKIPWAYTKSPAAFNLPLDPRSAAASGGFQRLNSTHFVSRGDRDPHTSVGVIVCDDRSFVGVYAVINLYDLDFLTRMPTASMKGCAVVNFGLSAGSSLNLEYILSIMELPSSRSGKLVKLFRLSVDREGMAINVFFEPSHILEYLGKPNGPLVMY